MGLGTSPSNKILRGLIRGLVTGTAESNFLKGQRKKKLGSDQGRTLPTKA
jgi:hypothetical protein